MSRVHLECGGEGSASDEPHGGRDQSEQSERRSNPTTYFGGILMPPSTRIVSALR
jgi:hypothetical protein